MSTVYNWLACLLLLFYLPVALPAVASAGGSANDLVLTEAEWFSPNVIRIPFTLTGTLITVRARIDTLEGNFFFDTGASTLLLNRRHFGGTGIAAAGGGGITGQVNVLGLIRVDTLRLDNLLVADLSADVVDLAHIEMAKKTDVLGIIGYAVFKDYEVLFDYAAARLLLVRTDGAGQPLEEIPSWEYKRLDSHPINTAGHVALLRLTFGPKKGKWFAIDSGAEQNLLSNTLGGRFLKENFDIRKRVKLRGMGKESVEVLSGTLQHAQLGSHAFKPMITLLTNLSAINAVYGTTVDGILGYEFLSQEPVSINYKQKTLTFYTEIRP